MASFGLNAGFDVSAGVSAGLSAGASLSGGLGLNAAFSLATNLLGVRSDPYRGFNFLVEIEGLVIGGFTEVTGLAVETQVQEYQEGGQNEFVHKLPGPARYPQNLTFKRGLTDLQTLWSWHQDVVAGTIDRKNGTIYLLNHQGIPTVWWDFKEAYPVKWTGPELRAESNTVALESIELAHRGIAKPAVAGIVAGIAGALSASLDASLDISGSLSFGL